MKGFKDSTKVQYYKDGGSVVPAKDARVRGAAKISKVMSEFKAGDLHSGSKKGPKVTNPKQATAIALSEARKAGAKMPMKKANGGLIDVSPRAEEGDVLIAKMTPAELKAGAAGIRAAKRRLAEREMARKAVPVAPSKPLLSSETLSDIGRRAVAERGYKKGGMAVKKSCK